MASVHIDVGLFLLMWHKATVYPARWRQNAGCFTSTADNDEFVLANELVGLLGHGAERRRGGSHRGRGRRMRWCEGMGGKEAKGGIGSRAWDEEMEADESWLLTQDQGRTTM